MFNSTLENNPIIYILIKMKQTEYLNHSDVQNFVQWMSKNLNNETFAHAYVNRKDRRVRTVWRCNSLVDAVNQYNWKFSTIDGLDVVAGSSYEVNTKALSALQTQLTGALAAINDADSNTCQAAVKVMQWGGVSAGNNTWLNENQAHLAQTLANNRDIFDAGDTEKIPTHLRFNAGMTKVYSLICENFIIYDSRVAAALGWSVVKFCKANNLTQVPDALRFPWAPAKEDPKTKLPKRRNPSENGFDFPRLRPGEFHAKWNLKASWLLTEILAHHAGQNAGQNAFAAIDQGNNPLRAFEAALFMIGYDLNTAGA